MQYALCLVSGAFTALYNKEHCRLVYQTVKKSMVPSELPDLIKSALLAGLLTLVRTESLLHTQSMNFESEQVVIESSPSAQGEDDTRARFDEFEDIVPSVVEQKSERVSDQLTFVQHQEMKDEFNNREQMKDEFNNREELVDDQLEKDEFNRDAKPGSHQKSAPYSARSNHSFSSRPTHALTPSIDNPDDPNQFDANHVVYFKPPARIISQLPLGSRMFIGNISSDRTDFHEIARVFARYGNIYEIILRGSFGFVQFDTIEACEMAIKCESGNMLGGLTFGMP